MPAWNGKCYDTPALALTAFQESFPVGDSSGIASLVSSSVAGTPGTITYSVRYDSFASTATPSTQANQTVALSVCNSPLPTDFAGTFIIVMGLCIMVVMGFMVGRAR